MRTAVLTLGLLLAFGQSPAGLAQEAIVPTVGFGVDFPGSQPDRYAFSIPSKGDATYFSDGKLSPQADNDLFRVTFTISSGTRRRIFDLTKRANYFEGDLDLKKKGLANTGVKTLSYKDEQKNNRASYNYSKIPAVQDLTQLLQSLSTTLEFGRRIEYYHRYQKLALDDELKRMEEMAQHSGLMELAAVAPVLQQIADDKSVMNVVRARAQRLLEMAGVSGQ